MIYPWFSPIWTRLSPWRVTAPHAVLLHGAAGIGKLDFGRELARFWLCEKPGATNACGECPSCALIGFGNHPDLVLIRPEAIALLEGAEDDDNEDEPDAAENGESEKRGSRAPSREIRIGQIQALIEAATISTQRQGRRVALIYPAETMNTFTANALLKLLEEPPGPNHLILVTDAPHRLLPTVLSRCQQVALPAPDALSAAAWLKTQQIEDPDPWLAEAGGAPLAALRSAGADAVILESRQILLDGLCKGTKLDALVLAERLAKADRTLVVGWLQRWTWDCLGYRLASRIRYYPRQQAAISVVARQLEPMRLARFARTLTAQRRAAEHPLNARLFFEDLLLRYLTAIA